MNTTDVKDISREPDNTAGCDQTCPEHMNANEATATLDQSNDGQTDWAFVTSLDPIDLKATAQGRVIKMDWISA